MWTCLLSAICALQFSGAPLRQVPIDSPGSPVALAAAHTQTEAEATRPELSGALSRLKPQQKIRVELANANAVEGRFLKLSDETLVLGLEEKDLVTTKPVPFASIERVQVEKDWKMVGTITGAVSGATIFAVWFAERNDPGDPLGGNFDSDGQAALVGGVLGAVVGAVTGVIVGSTVNYWKPVYPKP